MKKTGIVATIILMTGMLFIPCDKAAAAPATDGYYQLDEVSPPPPWDGTDANRTIAPNAGYVYTYGDEAARTYNLPWPLSFYGVTYNQINVDTNGNIWFTASGAAHSFNLATTGRGPVIAAWNSDLSSNYYGGVFVQHKQSPERVVIEWQAETYNDEGFYRTNDFEVVLYPNGNLRADYKTFNAVNNSDSGSGISKDDGTHYLGYTSNAFSLAGKSLLFTYLAQPVNTLNVHFSGTGSGLVTSSPSGIACNTNCSAQFPTGTEVTLNPEASPYSSFTGWTNGSCSGISNCLITLNSDAAITAGFEYDATHQVQVIGGPTEFYSSTIQAAYNIAADTSIIKLWATNYSESLICNRPVTVTLKGGYDSRYGSIVGGVVLSGKLTISSGKVIANGVSVR